MIVVDLVKAYMRLFICKYAYIHTYIAFAHLFISLIVWLVVIWGLRRRGVLVRFGCSLGAALVFFVKCFMMCKLDLDLDVGILFHL